jgi:sigma-B regulation protein RsbU (phosphoserine phosphatase)
MRRADTPSPARRRQALASLPLPADSTSRTALDLLLHSWPGRLFIIAAAFKVLVALVRLVGEPPRFVQVLSTAATIGLLFSVVFFTIRLILLVQRQLLWRVRRKLILSYIFIGVVPAALIIVLSLLGGGALAWSVSAYLFRDGYDEVTRNVQLLADAASVEVGRVPKNAADAVERVRRNGAASLRCPALSMALVPSEKSPLQPVSFGPWEHLRPPADAVPSIPQWLAGRANQFTGTVVVMQGDAPNEPELVVRAVRPAGPAAAPLGWVIVDVPLDQTMLNRLHEVTGVKMTSVALGNAGSTSPAPDSARTSGITSLFRQTFTMFDTVDWNTGQVRRATVLLTFKIRELYGRLATAQTLEYRGLPFSSMILLVLVVVAVLFLIIEIAALVMGLALARSITSSVHELFMGTERVRMGDFTHRININTKDQLGELAISFNQMTGSIENLLQTAAEKKRLDEELRIARQIQMSLLPRGPLDVPGLGVTALCVPAREVGGDYYDFFPLEHDRLGVLIADVAGKGTSAALYMAELKGLVLSLSQIYQSPRQLLIEVNRILSANLDSRSFITMTYMVLDLRNGVMTYARAGHTPLIYLPGPTSPLRGAQVLTPSGMVLGVRIDGAAAKFVELLEEEQITLHRGDVIVLYTDGITEAMNAKSDLFGESRLSRIVEEHGHLESGELRERILREIEAFVGSADQHDDMTMILMKVEGFAAAERVAV